MKASHPISRRALIQASLGAAAVIASPALPAATPTPQQTEGPFFPAKPQNDTDFDMTLVQGHSARAQGELIEVEGQVIDIDGAPVAEALVDVWQANTHGRYAHERDPNPAPLDPNFQGWARLTTDAEGRFRVRTIKPGAYAVGGGWSRPPHIHYKVARRGFHELTTQMYFAGDPLNDKDRVLGAVPEAQRASLIVDFTPAGEGGALQGRFVMVLRRV